jgi:hypothetical protein
MGFLNKDLEHYLKFFIFFIAVYTFIKLIVKPYLRLKLLK